MSIRMIGIDHSTAEIDIRTIFSFTKTKCADAVEQISRKERINGCVLLSTCNRMELYVSCEEEYQGSLYELVCSIRELNSELYRNYFVYREEEEAVSHLFHLASGLKSRILGEDQILTQVKDALTLAREHYAADNVLETLFRTAVTAAKKVKTEVVLSIANRSVIHQALATLAQEGYQVEGRTCMVIGNGEMGKLAATVLQQAGADVTVTVRQYRSGIVDIPRNCKRIDYGERMTLFPRCDFVISATASPNYTLKEHCVREAGLTHPIVLVDLAVPRDIDPLAGRLPFVKLYDIDYFHADVENEKLKKSIECAENILKEQMEEFYVWYECRDMIPKILGIKKNAVVDLDLRIQKIIRDLPMEEQQQKALQQSIETAASKVVNKMMFGLRDTISRKAFRECVEGLEKVYEK